MNTVFKFGLDATLLLAVAGAAALDGLFSRAARPGPARAARRAAAVVAIAAALATSALALAGQLATRRVETPRWTLDGLAYRALLPSRRGRGFRMDRTERPGPARRSPRPGAPSYREFGRFSTNTGLPTVVGWDYHLTSAGRTRDEVDRRIADVDRLYDPLSLRDPGYVLSRYGVSWVVSGAEEREAHGTRHEAVFRALSGLLSPAFTAGDVTLYRVLAGERYEKGQSILDLRPPVRPSPDETR